MSDMAKPPKPARNGQHWIPKDQLPPKKPAKFALFPGVNKRTQKLNKQGSETKERIIAKYQKKTGTRTSPKGHMLWAHEKFDAEAMARRFRFGEQPSPPFVTEARLRAVVDKSPRVLGWTVNYSKARTKSAISVTVRYNCLHQSGAPYEDMVPLWSLWELVAFGKALKQIGTKRTAQIPHAMELCARCPAFWWSLALWVFAEVTRTVDKASWKRVPSQEAARKAKVAEGKGDDQRQDTDNEAEAPNAAEFDPKLQLVPAEDDDVHVSVDAPAVPSTTTSFWPPQCPKGRAVSIPGPFETLIQTLFRGCWEGLSERTIQHRIAAVLGVKAGPLPQTYHVQREESMTENMKESEEKYRAKMKEFRGKLLEKNRESYRLKRTLEAVNKKLMQGTPLADIPEELQQELVAQFGQEVEEAHQKRQRDPLEEEIFGRSDDEEEKRPLEDNRPKAAKRRKGEHQRSKDADTRKAEERKKKDAVGKAPEESQKSKGKDPSETEKEEPMKKKKPPEDKAPEAAKERKGETAKTEEPKPKKKKKETEEKGPEAAKERKEETAETKRVEPMMKMKQSEEKGPEAARDRKGETAETKKVEPMMRKKPPEDKAPEAAKERKEERQKSKGKEPAETQKEKPMKNQKRPEDKAPEAAKERKEETAETEEPKPMKQRKQPEEKRPEGAKERKDETAETKQVEARKKRKQLEEILPEVAKRSKEEKAETEKEEPTKKKKPPEDKAPEAAKERKDETAETKKVEPVKKKKPPEDKAPEAAKERKDETAETKKVEPVKKKKPPEDKAPEAAKGRKEEKAETEKEEPVKKKKPPEDKAPEAAKERKEERQKSKGKDPAETEEPKCAKKVDEREARTSLARKRQRQSDVNMVPMSKKSATEAGENMSPKKFKFKVSDLQGYVPPNPAATFKKLRPGPAEPVEL